MEGPFIAKETSMPGAFCLLSQIGEELPYSWNADSLKRFFLSKNRGAKPPGNENIITTNKSTKGLTSNHERKA
jgi:hypothetical protein